MVSLQRLVKLSRRLRRVKASWRLVRYEGDRRGGSVAVESWSSADVDLFALLAMMVLFRDHRRMTRGGKMRLWVYAPDEVVVMEVR